MQPLTPAGRIRCCMPWPRSAPSTRCRACWRWRRPWPVGSASATAARSRSTESGNGCASRVPCWRRDGCWRARRMGSLATRFCGIDLAHPVLNGSGTLDALAAGTLGVSAFVTKTVTLNPRAGNPPRRIAETPQGMVNSIGLANPGLERFCDEHLPRLGDLGVPLIVSVGGWSREEYAVAVRRIGAHPAVAALELNVSCPNVDSGCISIGTDSSETRALLERCRAETDRPLLAKLSPSVADVSAVALAAAEGGAAGLVLINPVRGMAIDRGTLQPLLGGGGGGRSRPAAPGRGRGWPPRSRSEACRPARDLPLPGRHRAADRRRGRHRRRPGLPRVRGGGGDGRRGRHRPFPQPRTGRGDHRRTPRPARAARCFHL